MIGHYLKSAGRKIRRAPLTSAINVFALALGFICFIAAIGIGRYWTMSDRHFEKVDRILLITQQFGEEKQVTGFRPLIANPIANYLKVDFPMLQAVARVGNKRQWTVNMNERKATLTGARADADILKIFDFEYVEGQAATALNTSDSVVLTKSAARKLFGETPAVGQQIDVGGEFYPTVAAVIESPQPPSHLSDDRDSFGRFDFIYGWPDDSGEREWWLGIGAVTYVLLPKDESILTVESFRSQLGDFLKRRLPTDQAALTKTEIDVLPLSGLQARLIDLKLFEGSTSKLSIQTLLTVLGLIVLIVACINYANLATAQAVGKAKEVGMRRVIGADSWQILLQYWIEALVLTLSAAAIALLGVWFLAPLLNVHVGIDMRLGLFDDITPILVVVSLVFLVALLACSYPVLFLSGVQPIDAIRQGNIKAGPRLGSRILVTLQFLTASTLLIILFVINQQNSFLRESSIDNSPHEIALLIDDGSRSIGYQALGDDLASDPNIIGTSHLDFMPWSDHENFLPITRAADGNDDGTTVFYNQVGYRYFALLDTDVIVGRSFEETRNDLGGSVVFGGATRAMEVSIVVDRAFAEALGFSTPASAIGAEVYLTSQFRENFSTNPTLRIVGVVENSPMVLAASGITANLYALADQSYGYPIVFIDKNKTAEGLAAINHAVVARDPSALVSTQFMDQAFAVGFRTFDAINSAFAALSIIALIISLLGAIGMAAFATSRRRHEIGVRKTLGSTVSEVVLLLLRDFSKPVIIGSLLAWPLAYYGASIYLENFIVKIDLDIWPWVASFLLINLIAIVSVSGQSYAAARVPPSKVLRYE